MQTELLPYVLLTSTIERCYSKPRGYAGDYLTIEKIYNNRPEGAGRIGAVVDRLFLEMPAADRGPQSPGPARRRDPPRPSIAAPTPAGRRAC